ncbi:MAG: hypothetical protein ACHQPI_03910 [Thermoanaerobaculia bacterium]
MTKPIGVGDALVEAGELTVRRLGRASTWRQEHGGTIERALLTTGAVSEDVLTTALSRAYGLPGVTREELAAADPDVVAALSSKERRRFRALPFRHEGKLLHVAVSDPRSVVLGRFLAEVTGFSVKLFVVPDAILEDYLGWFDKGCPLPPPPTIGPVPARATGGAPEREAPPESIEKLARILIGEALRFGATEMTLGADSRGSFVRTFHSDRAALTQRLSQALQVPLVHWFEDRCRREGGFLVEFSHAGEPPQRRRVDLLGSTGEEARLRFVPAETSPPGCAHPARPGDVFCPRCGTKL